SDRETLVTVTLTNNGDSSILGVKPVVSGAVTNSGSDRFDLPPHSSKTVVLSLTPLEDSASVSFESASGVTAFAAAVPFERTQASSTPWIVIALVALFLVLVAYFFWVKPQENNYY
ncbi:hypothetical protein HUU53_05100, partial [Candidatus Micrarchaeota archaeon]|nr:hypothetical protein [Candidatus Micrarchaeota archaeon]